jgi:FkbM family methyltransferase
MKIVKKIIKSILEANGYSVSKINPPNKRQIYNTYYMGDCFKCIKDDPLTEELLLGKGWDNQLPKILESIPDGLIVEIGANIGTSLLPHSQFFPHLQFYLYEPVPVFYQILQENFKTFNKKNNVHIEQFAFASTDNEVIEINVGLGTAGKSKMVQYQLEDSTFKIKSKTIDSLFADKKISLLKIDVDGHEIDVLKGAKEVIRKQKPIIFLEFAPKIMKDIGLAPNEITEFLKEAGYNNIKIWDNFGNLIKLTNDWSELLLIASSTPHYLDILVS